MPDLPPNRLEEVVAALGRGEAVDYRQVARQQVADMVSFGRDWMMEQLALERQWDDRFAALDGKRNNSQ